MADERRRQLRIGAFAAIVLAALALVATSLQRPGGLFSRRITLYAEFNDVSGLFVNAPVLLSGFAVGNVRQISFLPPGEAHAVRIALDLDRDVSPLIRGDSTATVVALSLLGDMYVAISRGSARAPPIPDGGLLPSEEPTPFYVINQRAAAALEEVAALAAQTRQITSGLGEAIDADTIARTARSLRDIAQAIESGDGLLHQLIYSDPGRPNDARKLAGDLRRTLQRMNRILAAVQSGHGLAHDLVYGEAPDVRETLAAMQSSAQRLESVLRKLDEGQGSLGALLNDPEVYDDLKQLLSGARESTLLRALLRLAQ